MCGANLSYYKMCERNVEVMNSLQSLRFPIMYVVVDADKLDHGPKIIES